MSDSKAAMSDDTDARSTEFEEGLLGACILEPRLFVEVGRIGKQFADHHLGRAYNCLADAHANGKPVSDFRVFTAELKAAGLFDSVGGHARLGRVVTDTPGHAHAVYYASEISQANERRRWRKLAATINEHVDRGETSLVPELVRQRTERIAGANAPATTITSSATDSLHKLIGKLQRGEGDQLFDAGEVFDGFECGPGLLTAIAAGPGSGKTALAMQFAFSALERNPGLRFTVANAETGFDRLLKRELTRLSGVPSRALRFADLTQAQMEAVEQAAAYLEPLLTRVDVLEPPYTLDRISQLQSVAPGLLLLDYLQKFSPSDMDARTGATAVAAELRNLCHKGWAVIALSATTRTKGKNGSGHDSSQLTLASLKESGEIEFNCDAVYLLRDQGPEGDPDEHVRYVNLDLVKNRNDGTTSTEMVFDKPRLSFRLKESAPELELDSSGEFEGWGDDTDDEAPWRTIG